MKKQINIPLIIKQRLNLQTVQRNMLNKYNLAFLSLDTLKRKSFLTLFFNWEMTKQDSFLEELGGRINIRRTREWIERLNNEN